MRSRLTLIALALTPLFWMPSAQAQLFGGDDEARRAIIELRGRVQQLESANQALSSRVEAMSRGQLELLGRVEQLSNDLATVRGGVETTARQTLDNQRQQQELSRAMEQELAAARSKLAELGPQSVMIDGETFSLSRDEKALFDQAEQELKGGDPALAARLFRQFTVRYAGSVIEPLVLQREGTAAYVMKDYTASIRAFNRFLADHPGHPRESKVLLTLSAAQAESKDVAGARRTLQRLQKDHPGTDDARTAADRLKLLGGR